jgi:hypothetical protein
LFKLMEKKKKEKIKSYREYIGLNNTFLRPPNQF